MFGVLLTILLAVAGTGVDAMFAFRAQHALQKTADAAALAAGADVLTGNTQISALVSKYVSANAPPESSVNIERVAASFDANAQTVSVTVTGEAPTAFMQLIGVTAVDVRAVSTAKRAETGPLDLVLALDVTGSMSLTAGGSLTKMSALQAAAKTLVGNIMTSSYAKVGIVPFSSYIRIDPALRDKNWVEAAPDTASTVCSWSGGTLNTCDYENYACVIDGLTSTCKRPVNCQSSVTLEAAYSCRLIHDDWGGCLISRMTNGGAYMTEIEGPTAPRYSGRKGLGAGTIGSVSHGSATTGGCPAARVLDLTSTKAAVISTITSLYGSGETFIPDGLLWAWNMLTPDEPLTMARSKTEMDNTGGRRVVILMTDGYNTLFADPDGWHSAIGENAAKQSATDNATQELCTKIKADGIILYTVAFAVDKPGIKQILQQCATDGGKYFDASDTTGLSNAFAKIGASLQGVRLMQ